MKRRAPWWFVAVVIAVALPVFSFPAILAQAPTGSEFRTLVWLFPAYIVVSAVCSLICFRQRPEVAWILVVLMALSDAAMWMMGTGYGQ